MAGVYHLARYAADEATVLATGTTALSTGTWYRIEAMWGTGSSAAWAVKIAGTVEISGSTGNLGTSNHGYFGVGKLHNRNGNTVDFYYDHVAVDSEGYPGAGYVIALFPNANAPGSRLQQGVQWVANDGPNYYTQVNTPAPNGTNYIQTSVNGDQALFEIPTGESAGLGGTTIVAVKVIANVSDQSGNAAANIACRLSENNLNNDTTGTPGGILPGIGYGLLASMWNVDPLTSQPWQLSGLDNITIGVNNLAAATVRCDLVAAMIDYQGTAMVGTLTPPPDTGVGTDSAVGTAAYAPSADTGTGTDTGAAVNVTITPPPPPPPPPPFLKRRPIPCMPIGRAERKNVSIPAGVTINTVVKNGPGACAGC